MAGVNVQLPWIDTFKSHLAGMAAARLLGHFSTIVADLKTEMLPVLCKIAQSQSD